MPDLGNGLLGGLGDLAGGIGRGISDGAGAVAEGLGFGGGGGGGPFFNPTPDIGPLFDGGIFGGGGGGGGPFYNPTPQIPTGLLDFDMPQLPEMYDNPWIM